MSILLDIGIPLVFLLGLLSFALGKAAHQDDDEVVEDERLFAGADWDWPGRS